jgi:tetrahydromethanopterin S-methyltransferase subunit E
VSTGILEQWRAARRHPIAALIGAAFGGALPLTAYRTMHGDLQGAGGWQLWVLSVVVAACLLFSVRTVWQWGRAAFGDTLKASCFVVALEGIMIASPTPWLALLALLYLICINAVATACILAHEDQPVPQPTVTAVARELGVPRRAAAKVLDQRQNGKQVPA